MKILVSIWVIVGLLSTVGVGQVVMSGNVYESDNRGYLNEVLVQAWTQDSVLLDEQHTDADGGFSMDFPTVPAYLTVSKSLFHQKMMRPSEAAQQDGQRYYFKVEMQRRPGYMLDLSLAPVRESEDIEVDAIQGARIEVYNHTTQELLFEDDAYPSPHFNYTLTKDNHYTILIRHPDYLAKRIEAYVNVKGCILCIEGIDEMTPGVSDHLTAGHEMGTLLANIEMEPLVIGKKYEVDNIYYAFNSAELNDTAKLELDKLIFMLRNNPRLYVEMASHTDSRGDAAVNLQLSQRRAESVVSYLITHGGIAHGRVSARGYGATQIANHCEKGIDCSEAEHAVNRRTELVIQEVKHEGSGFKPLLDILAEERMDQMIEELGEEEVIEIKEGEELPEELRRQLEAQEEAKKKNKK